MLPMGGLQAPCLRFFAQFWSRHRYPGQDSAVNPRVGRPLAFGRDSPPSRSGPKAPRGGGGGAFGGGGLAAEEGFSKGLASRC